MPFNGTRHGDAMAYVIVATLMRLFSIMTSRGLDTYYDVVQCTDERVTNIHYQTWIAQGWFIYISRAPSKQWGVCDKATIAPQHNFYENESWSLSNSLRMRVFDDTYKRQVNYNTIFTVMHIIFSICIFMASWLSYLVEGYPGLRFLSPNRSLIKAVLLVLVSYQKNQTWFPTGWQHSQWEVKLEHRSGSMEFNSLWLNDAIWHVSGSILAQVVTCCLTTRHYLDQCWYTISKV